MWKHIEALDWYNNSKKEKGYDIIKSFVLANYSEKLTDDIRNFITKRYNELHTVIEAFESVNGRVGQYSGDDSYGDMIRHVIGLGEDYFNSVINDPFILNDLEVIESFAYAIPYEDDFQTLDINFHKKRAIKALQAITEIMVAGKASIEDVETMRQMQNRFMFMATGNIKEATRGYNDHRYNEYYQFNANTQQAMFSNYLNDAQQAAHLIK